MNGQLVVVKDFMNKPLVRKAVYTTEDSVFISSERSFEAVQDGSASLHPIGFRRENVFAYDGRPLGDSIDWKKMRPWDENSN